MLRSTLALFAFVLAASCFSCATSQSGETDAGTEPDADVPDASLADASGFFQVALVGERWLFITPDGKPFYSVGVNHVTNNNNTDRDTGICPYCEAVASNCATSSA